jgi:hypothetical protein
VKMKLRRGRIWRSDMGKFLLMSGLPLQSGPLRVAATHAFSLGKLWNIMTGKRNGLLQ